MLLFKNMTHTKSPLTHPKNRSLFLETVLRVVYLFSVHPAHSMPFVVASRVQHKVKFIAYNKKYSLPQVMLTYKNIYAFMSCVLL